MLTRLWEAGSKKAMLEDELHSTSLEEIQLDDLPSDPLGLGPNQKKHAREMDAVGCMMTDLGWTEPLQHIQESPISFRPEVFKPGNAWEQDINAMKQKILDEKNAHNSKINHCQWHGCENPNMQETSPSHNSNTPNVIKVVDKSYLEKKFHKEGASEIIDSTVQDFLLNKEQEHAFCIITNHAISENPEQLCMYLGGMGGKARLRLLKHFHAFSCREMRHIGL